MASFDGIVGRRRYGDPLATMWGLRMGNPQAPTLMHAVQRQEILNRTNAMAKRGLGLREWGLRTRGNPLDPDSSLAADDAGFMTDYAGDPVSGTALFPIMNATDDLGAAGELIEWRPRSKNAHIAALLTVCRAAAESASRTIWMLSDPDRAIRRSCCVRFETSELDNQRGFHKSERDWFDAHPSEKKTQQHKDFEEHVSLFDKRVGMLTKGRDITPKVSVPGSTEVIGVAADWIKDHPPRHDPRLYNEHFPIVASRLYRVSSGFVHGYKWAMDYVQKRHGDVDTHRMAAEAIGIAVGIGECAVALYEAQAQRHGAPTDRLKHYPKRLEPTISEYSDLYY